MTFRVFFLTITIQKRCLSETEIVHEQQIRQLMDEVKDRRSSYYNHL